MRPCDARILGLGRISWFGCSVGRGCKSKIYSRSFAAQFPPASVLLTVFCNQVNSLLPGCVYYRRDLAMASWWAIGNSIDRDSLGRLWCRRGNRLPMRTTGRCGLADRGRGDRDWAMLRRSVRRILNKGDGRAATDASGYVGAEWHLYARFMHPA